MAVFHNTPPHHFRPHNNNHNHARSIFQPPKSPPPTTAQSDYFSPQPQHSRSRKRARPDSSHGAAQSHLQTPSSDPTAQSALSPGWTQCPTPDDPMYMSSACATDAVYERYRLQGGFDTPGLLGVEMEEQRRGWEEDGRWRRGRVIDEDGMEGVTTQVSCGGPLGRERNGVARLPSSPNGQQQPPRPTSWTSLALGAFGLVGKVFTFGTSVVKGFYAGGGKGYDLNSSQQQQQGLSDGWIQQKPNRLFQDEVSTPVPGSWQDFDNDDGFLGDFEQDNPNPSPPSRPPNKRRQTDRDEWVLVGTPEAGGPDTSPKRKVSSNSIATRASLGAAGARPTASRANSRRSLATPSVARRHSYLSSPQHQHSHNHSAPAQHSPQHNFTTLQDATQQPRRASIGRASFAPSRASLSNSHTSLNATHASRPSSSHGNAPAVASPYVSPETSRFLKRQARQDRAADKAMNSMSRRLEDLIRQGQEALGTKIEVEGTAMGMEVDEGVYVDEDD